MKFFLTLMMSSSIVCGAENKEMLFTLGQTSIVFAKIDGFIVNKSCGESCKALVNAKESGSKQVPSELLVGGKNPAAVRCKHFMEGTVIIGVDKEGNEQSFCKFSDGSYLNNSSIL